ncbi:MAG: protease inhibitor I42 family protein [Nitrospiria bacterium]
MIQGKNNVKRIRTKAGEPFKIRIWEDRTKGSRWVPTFDTALFRLLSDEYERTRNIRVTDSGMRYFEFVATNPGKAVIEFESRYGWKFSAEHHLTYEVEIAR